MKSKFELKWGTHNFDKKQVLDFETKVAEGFRKINLFAGIVDKFSECVSASLEEDVAIEVGRRIEKSGSGWCCIDNSMLDDKTLIRSAALYAFQAEKQRDKYLEKFNTAVAV